MSVQLALYKGRGTLFNALVRWWTRSPYSHCELVIGGACYSSSIRDGGVRGKVMALPADKWDVIDLPWADEYGAQRWFERHARDRYGFADLLLCQLLGMRRDARGVFCSEACAAALGLPDPTRYSPASLRDLVRYVNVNTVFMLRAS